MFWLVSLVPLLVLQSNLCPEDWLQDMERLLDELLLPLLSQPSLGRLWDSLRYVCPVWVTGGMWEGDTSSPEGLLGLSFLSIPGSGSLGAPAGRTLGTLRNMSTDLHSRVPLSFSRPEPSQHLRSPCRHCSPLCNPLSCAPAPEALPSLVSLGCAGGCPPLSIAGSTSPFPFLTALLSLLNILVRIHKGLCGQVNLGCLFRG